MDSQVELGIKTAKRQLSRTQAAHWARLSYATPGAGGLAHLGTEMFSTHAGIKMLHIPYKGAAPAVADVVSGRVDVIFDSISTSGEFIKSGKLKLLATTGARRMESMPDVPTVAESGVPGYEASFSLGLYAPRYLPTAIATMLNMEVRNFVQTEGFRKRVYDMGGYVPRDQTAGEFLSYLKDDSQRWLKVIRETGAKLD